MFPHQITTRSEYDIAYKESIENPERFWDSIAQNFLWKKKWERVLKWNFKEPKIEWFTGAKLNITENCLDRHLGNNGETTAIIWESNDPQEQPRTLTYKELHFKVCQFANVLKIME